MKSSRTFEQDRFFPSSRLNSLQLSPLEIIKFFFRDGKIIYLSLSDDRVFFDPLVGAFRSEWRATWLRQTEFFFFLYFTSITILYYRRSL